jgi:transposase InsO family protein
VHQAAVRLPAVSGSSGRLVRCGPRPRAGDAERAWPGQVFEDLELAYAAAMREFVRRSAPARAARRRRREPAEQQRRRAADRGQALQQRQQEDTAWEAACRARRAWLRPDHWTPAHQVAYLAAEDRWLTLRAQRQAALARRQQEDAQWLADQERRRAPPTARPPWIAILVVTDNCTRRCLGLPLFLAGAKVTAEEVVAALRALLPDELQFLISDRGTHFTACPFAAFAREEDFVHVLIARHRPESNGIAERFVRTLKAWLAGQTWADTDQLEALLGQFRPEYNDRPHQGLAIPGLSPNEFAARFWLT